MVRALLLTVLAVAPPLSFRAASPRCTHVGYRSGHTFRKRKRY